VYAAQTVYGIMIIKKYDLLRYCAQVLEYPMQTAVTAAYFLNKLLLLSSTVNYSATEQNIRPKNDEDEENEEGQKSENRQQRERVITRLECEVTTCLYLAGKVEDTARRVSDVCNVVRRCRLRIERAMKKKKKEKENKNGRRDLGIDNEEEEEKEEENLLIVGDEYYKQKDKILELERDVLRSVGFTLQTPQPHKYVLALVKRRYGSSSTNSETPTKKEIELALMCDRILEAVLFGERFNEVSDWTTKRVAIATLALAENESNVDAYKEANVTWEQLFGVTASGSSTPDLDRDVKHVESLYKSYYYEDVHD